MTTFKAKDREGDLFWVDFDGAEGIGFWVGNPNGDMQSLSLDVSQDLINWFSGWGVTDDHV